MSAYLLFELADPLPELRLLPVRAFRRSSNISARSRHARDVRLVDRAPSKPERTRSLPRGRVRSRGGPFGHSFHRGPYDDCEVGPRDRFVEPHDDIAGTNPDAIANQHFADNATSQVLHLFDVKIDNDRPGRDHRARQLGGCGPPAEPAVSMMTIMAPPKVSVDRLLFVVATRRPPSLTR